MNAQFELELGDTVAIRRKDLDGVLVECAHELRGRVISIYKPWWSLTRRYVVNIRRGDICYESRYKRSELRYIEQDAS